MSYKNRIGRTIVKNTCECVSFDKNNDMQKVTKEIYGDYSSLQAVQNAIRKQVKNERLLVQDWKQQTLYASMTLEEFIKNAEIKETKKEN